MLSTLRVHGGGAGCSNVTRQSEATEAIGIESMGSCFQS